MIDSYLTIGMLGKRFTACEERGATTIGKQKKEGYMQIVKDFKNKMVLITFFSRVRICEIVQDDLKTFLALLREIYLTVWNKR